MSEKEIPYNDWELLEIAAHLDKLQKSENDGRGVECVKSIIAFLDNGDLKSALAIREHDGDKTANYPYVETYLTQVFGCRTHGEFNCKNWLCVRK